MTLHTLGILGEVPSGRVAEEARQLDCIHLVIQSEHSQGRALNKTKRFSCCSYGVRLRELMQCEVIHRKNLLTIPLQPAHLTLLLPFPSNCIVLYISKAMEWQQVHLIDDDDVSAIDSRSEEEFGRRTQEIRYSEIVGDKKRVNIHSQKYATRWDREFSPGVRHKLRQGSRPDQYDDIGSRTPSPSIQRRRRHSRRDPAPHYH